MGSFTTNDGVDLVYRDTGGVHGTAPLVLVHSWIQSQAAFDHQYNGLAARRRVITLDLRGHGASGKPDHGYRIARLANDLRELLDHLSLDEVDLLGTSMGAAVCWSFIDQYGTGRIHRLVLVDQPSVVGARPWMTEKETLDAGVVFDHATLSAVCQALLGPDRTPVISGAVRGTFSGDPDPDLVALVERLALSASPLAAATLLWDHSAQDWRDILPRIDVPTLVIGCVGSHINPASQRYVAAEIPHAELHIFPAEVANSHHPHLENPAAFNFRVERFLDGHPGREPVT